MLKTVKKDLHNEVSGSTASKVLDALRSDNWTEDLRDLPKNTQGITLTISYSVPDPKPVKTRAEIGQVLDFAVHRLEIGDFIGRTNSGYPEVYKVISGELPSYGTASLVMYRIEAVGAGAGDDTAYLAGFWKRVEKPVVYPKVGQKVRWDNGRGDSATGRVYEVKADQFWFITDEYTGYAGPKGCKSFLTKLNFENGTLKIIAD